MDKALDELLTATPPAIALETVPRPKGEPGSPTKFYTPAANSANSANREQRRGFPADGDGSELSEPCEISPGSGDGGATTVRTVRESMNPAQTRVSIDSSQSSQSSHAQDVGSL